MTSDEKVRKVCANLSHQVSTVAPKGLGHWDPAWQIVEEPSAAFLEALAEFEVADTDLTRDKLLRAANAVVKAWRQAALEWEKVERPGAPTPEEVLT